MQTRIRELDIRVPARGVCWIFFSQELGEREHVHEVRGLEDGVGEAGFGEVFFDVALAVVVHEFAEDGVEDGGVDEVGDVVMEGGVDHVVSGFVSLTMGTWGGGLLTLSLFLEDESLGLRDRRLSHPP